MESKEIYGKLFDKNWKLQNQATEENYLFLMQ